MHIKGHTYEGTYTRAYTRRDMHMEWHAHEETCTWRDMHMKRHTHWGTGTYGRDMHMKRHIHGGDTHIKGHTHGGDMHIKGHTLGRDMHIKGDTHGGTYTQRGYTHGKDICWSSWRCVWNWLLLSTYKRQMVNLTLTILTRSWNPVIFPAGCQCSKKRCQYNCQQELY